MSAVLGPSMPTGTTTPRLHYLTALPLEHNPHTFKGQIPAVPQQMNGRDSSLPMMALHNPRSLPPPKLHLPAPDP